jgi:rSAM/selenodomain-associated transferase 1
MKPIAIVFARAPRLGTVKRRLARGIGDRAALRFHAATLNRLLRALARDGQFQVVLAITPDRARVRVPSGVAVIGQGRGDIGVRMARALARFPKRNAAIVGSDIPDAGPADLRAAFRALGAAQAVFGLARDGGYWLVGLGPLRPARPFAGARWSTRHALADTLRNFRGRRVASLRELDDVDDLDAWTAYQAADDRNAVSSNPSSVSSAYWSRIM